MRSSFGPVPAVEVGDWPRIGGHLTLDLANTVSWRLDPRRTVDYLTTVAALVDWLRVMDPSWEAILSQASAESGERALQDLRALRDAIITALDAALDGEPGAAPDAGWDLVARFGQRAIAASSLHPGLPSHWSRPVLGPDDLVHALSLATVTLLQADTARRIRRCEGPGCGWFFLDSTRNHSRRWCAAGDCGNRVRVRNYTQRRRNPPPG